MKKKLTLTLIVATALVCVIALSACGVGTAVASQAKDLVSRDPYPGADSVSPGFGTYSDVDYEEGYTPKAVSADMTPWEFYQAMSENYSKVARSAQVTTTISDINMTTTTRLLGILGKGKQLGIKQLSSWMTADDGNGNRYSQTISQMDTLGEDLSYLDSLTPNFGVWEKSKYIAEEKMTYKQKGNSGSLEYDATAPAGITAGWIKGADEIPDAPSNYDSSVFDRKVRVTADVETDKYKVDVAPGEYDNDLNVDEVGNKVIKVQFKSTDGKWTGDTWYVWDDVNGTTEGGQYVGFQKDRNFKALPSRGDTVSNYLVNEETFDNVNSKLTSKTVDGHTLYTLEVKLKETENYDWQTITSGELKSLQGGTAGFVDFSADATSFDKDLILKYEVWDNGSIRRVIRQYTITTGYAGGGAESSDKTSILGGNGYGYGGATNTQYQEFAYDGDVLDLLNNDMYNIGDGGANKWVVIGVSVGVAVVVIIAVIVTLVVLAKKGIIGKKKADKKEAEVEAEAEEDKKDEE